VPKNHAAAKKIPGQDGTKKGQAQIRQERHRGDYPNAKSPRSPKKGNETKKQINVVRPLKTQESKLETKEEPEGDS